MTENLLPAFNGQLDLRTAYNWNQSEVSFPDMLNLYQNGYQFDQVYQFLEDVVDNHANYGISMERGAELSDIRQHLLRLR